MTNFSHDQQYSQSFPHSQRDTGYAASPDMMSLKQQTEPEESQGIAADEDDGGSVAKSFGQDAYVDQVS